MSLNRQTIEGSWTSRWTFVAAASGLAIGLGSFWRFGHEVGHHGGGLFIAAYLLFVFVMAMPVMIAEVLLGSRGRAGPVTSVRHLALESASNSWWSLFALFAVIASLLVLANVSVFAGWILAYVPMLLGDQFAAASVEFSARQFNALLQSPERMIYWHSLFLSATLLLSALKMTRLLGQLLRILMPILLVMLVLALYMTYQVGDSGAAWRFLFQPRAEEFTAESLARALRQAFFTLGVGMGALMVFGAYFPDGRSIGRQVTAVVVIDSLVAIMAGLMVYALVLDYHIVPGSGPALLFVSLPYAFGNTMMGDLGGALFFVMLALVALTTAIALIEPAILSLVERMRWPRLLAVLVLGALLWLLGLVVIYSLSDWSELRWRGHTPLQWLDIAASTILVPLAALGLTIFAGWRLRKVVLRDELHDSSLAFFWIWHGLMRYIAPPAIVLVLLTGIYHRLLA